MGGRGIKTGGRKKGSKNKLVKANKYVPKDVAISIAKLDASGQSMAEIQINAARYFQSLADAEKAKEQVDLEKSTKWSQMAAKTAHDVSPYLYATHQSLKHAGDENAAPIRFEHLSEYQLEMLIQRLRR